MTSATKYCEHEGAVLAALDDDNWAPGLRDHAESCSACSETLLVASFLSQQAQATTDPPLPDPGYIWWRAQHQARADAARRATLPITIVQRIATLCGVVAALIGLIRAAPWLSAQLARFEFSPSPTNLTQPMPLLLTGVGLLVVILMLDLTRTWAEA